MSDKRYSIDELACALEAHFRRPGNDLSRFQVDAIIARLRKADELCEVAKEVVETTSQGPRLRSFGALSLSKAISDYEEGR